MKSEDIFDRLMKLPVLNICEPFYKKHKEFLLYLFFGGLSFLVNIGTYAWFNVEMDINELIANVLSWVITVLFAFFTNRIWVFSASTESVSQFFKQMIDFYVGRVITLVLEEVILFVFITKMRFSSIFIKILAQIIVIVLNYIISKLYVFKKRES